MTEEEEEEEDRGGGIEYSRKLGDRKQLNFAALFMIGSHPKMFGITADHITPMLRLPL